MPSAQGKNVCKGDGQNCFTTFQNRTTTKYGVEIVNGDLTDKEKLTWALQGVSTVVSTISSMPASYIPGENDIQKVDLEGIKISLTAPKLQVSNTLSTLLFQAH